MGSADRDVAAFVNARVESYGLSFTIWVDELSSDLEMDVHWIHVIRFDGPDLNVAQPWLELADRVLDGALHDPCCVRKIMDEL